MALTHRTRVRLPHGLSKDLPSLKAYETGYCVDTHQWSIGNPNGGDALQVVMQDAVQILDNKIFVEMTPDATSPVNPGQDYIINYPVVLKSLNRGLEIIFIPDVDNIADTTLQLNQWGPIKCVRAGGRPLLPGDLKANTRARFLFDGFRFVLLVSRTSHDLENDTVNGSKFKDHSITTAKLKDDGFNGEDFADGIVQGSNFAQSSISGDKLAAKTITGSKIPLNSLFWYYVAIGGIDASNINKGAFVDDSRFMDGRLTGRVVKQRSLTQDVLRPRSITSFHINSDCLSDRTVGENSVTGDKIQDRTLGGEAFASKTILGEKIAPNSVDGLKLGLGSVKLEHLDEALQRLIKDCSGLSLPKTLVPDNCGNVTGTINPSCGTFTLWGPIPKFIFPVVINQQGGNITGVINVAAGTFTLNCPGSSTASIASVTPANISQSQPSMEGSITVSGQTELVLVKDRGYPPLPDAV